MTTRRFDPAGLVAAIALFALAWITVRDMDRMQLAPFYGVGPKAMPYAVAAGFALLGIGNLGLAFRAGFPERETMDVTRVALILGGLAGMTAIVAFGFGFIAASTLLFAAVARAFAERPVQRLIGLGLLGTLALVVLAAAMAIVGLIDGAALRLAVQALVVVAIALTLLTLASVQGLRDLAIGFALALAAYLLFAKLLALTLPAGPLERLI